MFECFVSVESASCYYRSVHQISQPKVALVVHVLERSCFGPWQLDCASPLKQEIPLQMEQIDV